MAQEKYVLDAIEQLTLENLVLKEEVLKRDSSLLQSQKSQTLQHILAKYGVDPNKDKYELTRTELVVDKIKPEPEDTEVLKALEQAKQ